MLCYCADCKNSLPLKSEVSKIAFSWLKPREPREVIYKGDNKNKKKKRRNMECKVWGVKKIKVIHRRAKEEWKGQKPISASKGEE